MSLEKWHNEPSYTTAARELYKTQLFQDILGVLHSRIPSGYPLRGENITDTQAAIQLGRMLGYMDALDVINVLTIYKDQIPPEIEPDYGADKILEDENL